MRMQQRQTESNLKDIFSGFDSIGNEPAVASPTITNPWTPRGEIRSSANTLRSNDRPEAPPRDSSPQNPWASQPKASSTVVASAETATSNPWAAPGSDSICVNAGAFRYQWKDIKSGRSRFSNVGIRKAPITCCP